jgi:hypothetical protein
MDDVDLVTVGSGFAGMMLALAGAGWGLQAGARRDRMRQKLVLDLAAELPPGGRLVYQCNGHTSVTIFVAAGRDA